MVMRSLTAGFMLHASTILGVDSASAPSNATAAVRLPFGGNVIAAGDSGAPATIGQSYEAGRHRLR